MPRQQDAPVAVAHLGPRVVAEREDERLLAGAALGGAARAAGAAPVAAGAGAAASPRRGVAIGAAGSRVAAAVPASRADSAAALPARRAAPAAATAAASAAAPSSARRRSRCVAGGPQPFVDRGGGDDRDERQRNRPARPAGFACSVVGSSPIVGAVGCSVGASSAGARGAAGSAPSTASGIEVDEARVVAHEAAHERAARQMRVVVLLERPHLARRELQLLRDGVDRQAGRLARGAQQRAGRRAGGESRRCRPRHSRRGSVTRRAPVGIALVSAESG